MTKIAQTTVSKALVAFVAAAMLFTMFAAPVKAQTSVEDLQEMINDLMAQIAALSGTTGTTVGGNCAAIPAPLTIGAQNANVTALQNYLIAAGQVIPAGATGYFGTQTQSALAAWQAANGVAPAVGYYGPITASAMAAKCVPADEDEDEDDNGSTTDLSGEASLDSFEVDDADDSDVQEGDKEVEIAEITIEFTDGDAEISRLDLSFTDSEGTDSDPWDVFESFSLWVDGKMVAEEDADDEDFYLDEESEMRFSDIDVVGMEDEEVTIVVAATINNNLDTDELGEWDVKGVAMRFFDADGVATLESSSPVTSDTATFNIEVEGAGDDLDLTASSNDPDSSTLALDEDDNTEYEVFVFELDADDSDGDITLENLTIDLALSSTTRDLSEVVSDIMIEIDGESFSAEDYDGATATESVLFDIDGEYTIEAGETVEVVVIVEFEDMDADSTLQGVTLTASVDTEYIDAEGESGEEVTIGGSDQTGDAHTLRSEGLALDIVSITETKNVKSVNNTDVDYATFVFEFDVTAFGEDFYIDEATDVVNFALNVNGSASTTGYTAVLDIADADDAATADWKIAEGQTATFTLTVETNTGHDGTAEVVISSVDYSAADDHTEELNVLARPVDEWTSDQVILN